MPVGTQATVKGLTPRDLRAVGVACVLANTYHLWLRPGPDLVQRAGGLHAFMGWEGAILTDSGGFQELSLGPLCRIDERGASLQSHLDGEERLLTPELAMEIQAALDSDIAMVLDVCPPADCRPDELQAATERTSRWAARSMAAPHADGQAVFGIVQGGTDLALRARSAAAIAQLGCDGYGIGGLSIGEARDRTWPALMAALGPLPAAQPRYLMGVGAPVDLLEAIAHGVDLFDCVLPTRLGRNGNVFGPTGRLNLHNAALGGRDEPLDPACDCPACQRFPLGYLAYLVRAREDLGLRLASLHNVRYLTRLVGAAHQAIAAGRFRSFYSATMEAWGHGSSRPSGGKM
jgi:queuine tRNA-ribosyltransferase